MIFPARLEHLYESESAGTHPSSSAAQEVVPPSVQSKCWPGPGGVASAPPARRRLASTAIVVIRICMTVPLSTSGIFPDAVLATAPPVLRRQDTIFVSLTFRARQPGYPGARAPYET